MALSYIYFMFYAQNSVPPNYDIIYIIIVVLYCNDYVLYIHKNVLKYTVSFNFFLEKFKKQFSWTHRIIDGRIEKYDAYVVVFSK